jgi:hypothetical protein
MSTELDQAREIAERIARRVSGTNVFQASRHSSESELSSELASVRSALDELQRKITQLERKVTTTSSVDQLSVPSHDAHTAQAKPVLITHSPWLAGLNAPYSHPSQEKFGVEEATVTELVDFFEKEKICGVEPGGKPCDHCSMCSSRGF